LDVGGLSLLSVRDASENPFCCLYCEKIVAGSPARQLAGTPKIKIYNSLFETALFPTLSVTSIFKVLGFGSVK
jgi:hypothetical protein